MARTRVKEAAHQEKELSQAELEVAAYYHWINRGCPSNDDLTDWVEVERQWKSGTGAGEPSNN